MFLNTHSRPEHGLNPKFSNWPTTLTRFWSEIINACSILDPPKVTGIGNPLDGSPTMLLLPIEFPEHVITNMSISQCLAMDLEYPPDLVHAILGAYFDSIVQKNNLRHQVQLVSLDNLLDEIYHTEYVISHSFLKDSHETFATDHPEKDVVHEENAASEEHLVPAEEETVEERQEEPGWKKVTKRETSWPAIFGATSSLWPWIHWQ